MTEIYYLWCRDIRESLEEEIDKEEHGGGIDTMKNKRKGILIEYDKARFAELEEFIKEHEDVANAMRNEQGRISQRLYDD